MMTLKVNGRDHQIDADPDTPLLYILRDDIKLDAAKFGCGLVEHAIGQSPGLLPGLPGSVPSEPA